MSEPDAVTLAYVHDIQVAHSFHDSLVNLLMLDVANEGRVIRGGYIKMRCGSGGLVEARNKTAEAFLARNAAEWLFIVDTDMGFEPDTLERLVAAADPKTAPVVGALCFAWREIGMDDMSGFRCVPRPTVFDWVDTPEGRKFMGRSAYPADSLVRVAGTGSACILIHRSVLERVREDYGPTWYDRIRGTDGSLLGEDISLCVRVTACGFPIHVHTGIKTTHLKHVWVSDVDFAQYAALRDLALSTPPASAAEIETVTVDDEPRIPVHDAAG